MTRLTDPNLLRWHTPRFDLAGAEVAATMLGRSFAISTISALAKSGIDYSADYSACVASMEQFEADTMAWLEKIRDDVWDLNATSAETAAVLRAFLEAIRAVLNGGLQ